MRCSNEMARGGPNEPGDDIVTSPLTVFVSLYTGRLLRWVRGTEESEARVETKHGVQSPPEFLKWTACQGPAILPGLAMAAGPRRAGIRRISLVSGVTAEEGRS